jgi:hypothetical protein
VSYISDIADEIEAEVAPEHLPDEDPEVLFLIYAVLLLGKGHDVTRADVHNAWSAWMSHMGKEHESLVPFEELPADTKAEDGPYVSAIRRVVAKRAGSAA